MIQDASPTTEREIVDSRALQNAKIDPIPSTAADFRSWKSSLILLLGRLDISGSDYLTSWISHAFKVSTAEFCAGSSEHDPRLDRWLASELISGLKGVPDLQFKVQGYVERCTREGTAPRGRAVLQMISRHIDLDRVRGSLITSQSIFQVELHGCPTSDLQEFSAQVMKVFNSIPHDQWPNQRMPGEFLFHKLRTVRRLERVIDEIKRSSDDSPLRGFDFLWSRLQEFLVEEKEDANAKSIEQSLTSPKKSANIPKAKTPAVLRLHQNLCQRRQALSHLRKENQKDMESHWVRKKRQKHHASSIKCRQVVFMVQGVPIVIRKLHLQSPRVRAARIQSRSLRLHQQQQPRLWRLWPSLLRPCFSHPKLG